ncbi:hypothetical protein FOZ60_013297 [Perkinsus olseni]|uniref:Uncharacterized protein n=1 Tax=Perkinsus olseni TaxID=32597 RepID=A0A7J6NAJ6_PEROL|nr:hypothetical protein FOZ60_013297 [Perkinsus olseni]
MPKSEKNLTIPPEVAATVDENHLRHLYVVCRFCFARLTLPKRGTTANPPTQEVCQRALKFYQVDFKAEVTNLRLPKVLCNACRTRLDKMSTGAMDVEKWNEEKRHYYDALLMDYDPVSTRQAAICSEADRCKVCSVASALVPNFVKKAQSNAPGPGRPSTATVKRPRRAGVKFAERVAARGYTDTLVAQRLEERFRESTESGHESPLPSGVSLDSHHYLGVSSFSYGGEETGVVLSRESARDLLRLGHLGLGMRSARELCKILRRDGVYFPEGGLKKALDEKWDVFGPLFRSEALPLQTDRHSEATSTPFVFCTDINASSSASHNVVAQPVIQWVNSPLEFLSLSPLHLLLGIVNKLYDKARPTETSGASNSLHARHCKALVKYNIRRSVYFDGAFEGNGCSRLLDEIAAGRIPFEQRARPFVEALKAFKVVKDKCLGLMRVPGWSQAIASFRTAWEATSLPYTLKVHVLCSHVEEYLERYETVPDAGLGLSSEQSGESLHARLQRVWNLRFKANPNNEVFRERLVDCVVSYNWNLQWDEASRVSTEGSESKSSSEKASNNSSSGGSSSSRLPPVVDWNSASSNEDSSDVDSYESSSNTLD